MPEHLFHALHCHGASIHYHQYKHRLHIENSTVGPNDPASLCIQHRVWLSVEVGVKSYNRTITDCVFTGTVWAEPVSVYWQSSDLSLFPSAYATSLASAMNVPFLSATSPTSSTLPTRTPEALSVGAKAGIGVGAFFGVAIIAGALVFVSLRRRKRQKSMQHPDLPEMNGQDSGFKRMFAGKWRAEVDGSSKPVEIDSRNVMVMPGSPVELEGSQGTRFETLRRP
jgi:hypothetical protein